MKVSSEISKNVSLYWLCRLVFIAALLFICTAYSQPQNYKVNTQNTILSLNLNNQLNYDYEVYVNSDGSFSLPFKSIARLLDIQFEQNHITKVINFTSPDGTTGRIDYSDQKIIFGNKIYELNGPGNVKMVFLKQGLIQENMDEVFVPIKLLNEILGTEIIANESNYSVFVKTSRVIKALVNYEDKRDEHHDLSDKLVEPSNKRILSLDTIKLDSQVRIGSSNEEYIDHKNSDTNLNGLAQVALRGKLLNGNYEVNTDIYNNKTALASNGLSFSYNRDFENNNLQLGTLSGFKSNNYIVGSDVFGLKFGNIKDDSQDFRDISGEVSPDSKVNVYVNDKFIASLNTVGGYYTLRDLPVSAENIRKIKLEEALSDGRVNTIKVINYSYAPDLLPQGKTASSFLFGMAGKNRFFGNSGFSDEEDTRKLVGGFKVSRGITDKLTINTIGISDRIVSRTTNQNLFDDLQSDPYINRLMFGGYKDLNSLQGQTGILSFNYVPNKKLNLASDFGISRAVSIDPNNHSKNSFVGYSSSASANYSGSNYGLSGKVFNYSPDFYLAGTSGIGNNLDDRKGAELDGNLRLGMAQINGGISKYTSGLGDSLAGNKLKFNEYNLVTRLPFKDGSSLNFAMENKKGNNSEGQIINNSYEVNYYKSLTDRLNFDLTGRINNFDSSYHSPDRLTDNYLSNFKLLSAKFDYDIPKKLGKFYISHDLVRANANDYGNNYNAVRVGYTPPLMKNIYTAFSLGYHYAGLNKGFDLSASLGYQFVSGRRIGVTYSFNRLMGSLLNNVFIPKTSKSSLTFNWMDVLSLISGGVKSVGNINGDGYIKAYTFLDLNQNGIKDKGEPAIPDIPIIVEGVQDSVYSNKKGVFVSKGVPDGIYKIRLDYGVLPSLLSVSPASREEYLTKVEDNDATEVYFGLISTIGNITGKINITDEFGRKVNIRDLVVSVLDEKGEEAKYTLADEYGNYSISGLSPGKYTVKLDKDFIDTYNLRLKVDNQDRVIIIPPRYNDFVDIKDVNLEYTQRQ